MPRLRVDAEGRVMLSPEALSALGVTPGDVVMLVVDGARVVLTGREQVARTARENWRENGNGLDETLAAANDVSRRVED